MCHTTLSRVKHIAQRKSIAGLCRLLFYESPGVKDRKSIVIKSPGKSRTRGVLLKTLVKGTGNRSLQTWVKRQGN